MKPSDFPVSIENLKVELGGVSVLDIPCFCLGEKEVVSLIGPNGSGKSTLLLVVNCLLKPLSGKICFRGTEIISREDIFRYRRKISMVFQEPLLFDTTVFNNVASGLKIRGVSGKETKDRVTNYLKLFSIEHLANRSARKLSGGEAQRTSLARAFAIQPEIIFLDEPFSALDPPTRHALTDDLEKIVRDTGTSAVMVTHDQSEALKMSDRIVVMNNGRIVQTGMPSEVMNSPVNEFVANFVGMDTILEGQVVRNIEGLMHISVSRQEIEAVGDWQADDKVFCCIRPENVTIETFDPGARTSSRNVFPAIILDIDSMGPFLKLTLDCGFSLMSYVTREAFADLGLYEGKKVFASFKATSVHVIPRSV
ncbi:MAG TPA: ABC transporter ATP-binding protein [Geobacteraceae bacterium]|nr:ABC transporter ATP-binding protein [Geobacteraceae bacterium]